MYYSVVIEINGIYPTKLLCIIEWSFQTGLKELSFGG